MKLPIGKIAERAEDALGYLQEQGILETQLHVTINKQKLAEHVGQQVNAALNIMSMLDQSKQFEVQPSSAPDQCTLLFHKDRYIQNLEQTLTHAIEMLSENEKYGIHAQVFPRDDGKKFVIHLPDAFLKQIFEGGYHFDGILNRDEIPGNKQEILETFQELSGMDPETGEITIDGQKILQLLQAFSNGKHNLQDGEEDLTSKQVDEMVQRSENIPAFTVKKVEGGIEVHLDMNELSATIDEKMRGSLNKIRGVDVSDGESTSQLRININFKELADCAMHAAGALLIGQNGARVQDDVNTTHITYSTDLRKRDKLITALGDQISAITENLGAQIAGAVKGQTAPSQAASIKSCFLKSPKPDRGIE